MESAELLADAVGGLTAENKNAIARALLFLGIGVSVASKELIVSIDVGAARGDTTASFDSDTRRWRLRSPLPPYQGDVTNAPLKPSNPLVNHGYHKEVGLSGRTLEEACPDERALLDDWTEQLPQTSHVQFVKDREWASTALGPMRDWKLSLRLMVHKMLADPRAACLYWSKERVAIYNEPFVLLAASRHPAMLGSTARDAMPATWPFLSQMFDEIDRTGKAFSTPEFEMLVEKTTGFVEEAWYDGVFLPVRGENGTIEGLYNSGFETTRLKLYDRRLRLLHRISARPNFSKLSAWQHIVNACQPFGRDISLLVLYSAATEETVMSKLDRCHLHLQGALGIDEKHPAIPDTVDLGDGTEGLIQAFRSAKAHGGPILLEMPNGKLPDYLKNGVRWRGFEEPATHIIIMPLFVSGLIAGFLTIGLNPRRPFDEDHKQFIQDIDRVCTAVISSNISFDQARAREVLLSKQLTERVRFVRKLAEIATVGIYSLDLDGLVTWANSKYYKITGSKESAFSPSFMDYILEEDRKLAIEAYDKSRLHVTANTINVRLNLKWTPRGAETEEYCWVLASFTPNIEEGIVRGVLGCITDISHLKWAEQLQINTAEAAKEAKRQQERFIDMTSHEMRNPLSAIVQCADDISTSVERVKRLLESHMSGSEAKEECDILDSVRESAQVILLCGAHQKRIVDDILTLSKLDSSLLAITPVLVEPSFVLQQAMQMFAPEFVSNEIATSCVLEQSYHDLDANWIHCDPSRLTQILVNLLTNSIKFTKKAAKREIHVKVGASVQAPPLHFGNVHWFPSGQKRKDVIDQPRLDSGDDLYLTFAVQDTGKGIAPDEMLLLFHRFTQANPKTHVQYGGSGLGLFICRELTELQGGMIGSASVPDQGSTFAFFIKARRATSVEVKGLYGESRASRRSRDISAGLGSVQGLTLAEPARPRHPVQILLVEDNIVNQRVLTKQLRRLGCKVHIANHGLEALDFLQTTRYWRPNKNIGEELDVILMDWEMPVMDGLTCTKRLRDLEEQGMLTERLAVIGITANARAEQVQMAYAAGMDEILSKPFKVADVMARIESLAR